METGLTGSILFPPEAKAILAELAFLLIAKDVDPERIKEAVGAIRKGIEDEAKSKAAKETTEEGEFEEV